MNIIITAEEAIDKGIWGELCNLTGMDYWAVNEGLMDRDDKISLSMEDAKTLGLLNTEEA